MWESLLRPYWQDRKTNMPLALSNDEAEAMVAWVEALPEAADEAVEELAGTPGEHFQHADHIAWEWKRDSTWLEGHPDAAVGVIHFLASSSSVNHWSMENAADVLELAFDAGADREKTLAAAELLVGLGSARATQLVQRLTEPE